MLRNLIFRWTLNIKSDRFISRWRDITLVSPCGGDTSANLLKGLTRFAAATLFLWEIEILAFARQLAAQRISISHANPSKDSLLTALICWHIYTHYPQSSRISCEIRTLQYSLFPCLEINYTGFPHVDNGHKLSDGFIAVFISEFFSFCKKQEKCVKISYGNIDACFVLCAERFIKVNL